MLHCSQDHKKVYFCSYSLENTLKWNDMDSRLENCFPRRVPFLQQFITKKVENKREGGRERLKHLWTKIILKHQHYSSNEDALTYYIYHITLSFFLYQDVDCILGVYITFSLIWRLVVTFYNVFIYMIDKNLFNLLQKYFLALTFREMSRVSLSHKFVFIH